MPLTQGFQTILLKLITAKSGGFQFPEGAVDTGLYYRNGTSSYTTLSYLTKGKNYTLAEGVRLNQLWVGLCSEKPNYSDTAVSSEFTIGTRGVGYHRVLLQTQSTIGTSVGSRSASSMSDPAANSTGNMETHNIDPVMFFKCNDPEGWDAKYAIFFDAETGGTFIGWGKLETPQLVPEGQIPTFDVGELKLTFADDEDAVNPEPAPTESGESGD